MAEMNGHTERGGFGSTGASLRGLTVRQAADRLGISPSLVYALCREGVIAHTRHGRPGKRGCIRIGEAALEAYRKGCEGGERLPAPLPFRHVS
jgi:excisionase family DNA binding protein